MKEKLLSPVVKSTAVIGLSFLLTSVGHLAWMYHLLTMTTAAASDLLTLVVGYLLQAAGIAGFYLLRYKRQMNGRRVFLAALIAYTVCLLPAVLSTYVAVAVIFGLLQSLLCGVLAGGYLSQLTALNKNRMATSFGVGYGAATVAAWLLSLIGGGMLLRGVSVFLLCIPLTVLTAFAAMMKPSAADTQPQPAAPRPKQELMLAGAVVLLFSLVQNLGFSFSTVDIQNGVQMEFSRLFYAVGLVSAGLVSDKSRKYGALCALAALAIPFLLLALRGEPVSATVLWAIGYFGFGFYAVYRVVLFADLSKKRQIGWFAGCGLLIGRIGDAVGAGLALAFADNEAVRVISAAVLFAASVFVFFRLLAVQYAPDGKPKTERERLQEFAARHDLSAREREVLQLVLQNKRNPDIAAALFVSESTVKFHVHNLLKKTGCKTRVELCDLYFSHKQEG